MECLETVMMVREDVQMSNYADKYAEWGGGGFDCLFGHTVHGGFLSPGEEESRSGGGTRREARATMSC